MKVLSGLKYTREHEWVKIENQKAYIGITDYAQHSLGDIVFVELPEVGTVLSAGDVIGDIESVKAASDIYTPIAGTVIEVNEQLIANPGKINNEPYESWIAVVELGGAPQTVDLMDQAEYEGFCKKEG